jgi:hypothetical protein
MPKKIKVVDVNASVSEPAEASVVIVEADPVVEIPNEEQPVQVVEETSPPAERERAEQAEPEATAEPKKKRAPRARSVKPKKREPVEVEEVPQPAEPVVEIVEAPVVVEEAEEKPKKQVKTLELVECEKCGKKLTQRTLKYSHQAVCPGNNPPAEAVQKPKRQRKPPPPTPEEPQDPMMPSTLGLARRLRRNERYKHLVANAF